MAGRERRYYNTTRGLCSLCGRLVPAKVLFEGGRVFMEKYCPDHKITKALLYSDEEKYKNLMKYTTAGKSPLRRGSTVRKGCPYDCGLCESHSQHTCLPIIEITDRCNLRCPICIANNGGDWEITTEEFSGIINNLISCEGKLDLINISGGEPTLHRNIQEILNIAVRPEITTVSISTNGLMLLHDENLVEYLAANDIFVSLQFDGFSDGVYQALRGWPLLEAKMAVLEKLRSYNVPTSMVVTVAKGVNDSELGEIVSFFLKNTFIRSLMVQPLSVHTSIEGIIPFDPLDRITIPDAAKLIADGSGGVIRQDDILPLPCSHPACFSLAYLFDMGDGELVPINRLIDIEKYLNIIRDKGILGVDDNSVQTLKRLIYELWSSPGMAPITKRVLDSARELLREISRNSSPQRTFKLGRDKIKSVFLHHFMDRYNFDLSRANKCCQHYPGTDGKMRPCCVHNAITRKR